MDKPASVADLTTLGRGRLSDHFFMRDMLYSEVANFHGLSNIPDDPDLAIATGEKLCQLVLEPLHRAFGGIAGKGRRERVGRHNPAADCQRKTLRT